LDAAASASEAVGVATPKAVTSASVAALLPLIMPLIMPLFIDDVAVARPLPLIIKGTGAIEDVAGAMVLVPLV
jgi:hypothetical protein